MKLRLLVAAAVFMLFSLPVFAAYEAHLIGVKAELIVPETFSRQVEGPTVVPIRTYQEWSLTYRIMNIFDQPITELELSNQFGTHLDVSLVSVSNGDYQQSSNKRGNKEMFSWHLGSLERRQRAALTVRVSTGVKKGKQVFINAGVYELTSEAKLTWLDHLGKKQSTMIAAYTVTAE